MPEQVHPLEDVLGVLGLGPKFAVQTKKLQLELLFCVQQVSRLDLNYYAPHWISQGVDIPSLCKLSAFKLPAKCVAKYLADHPLFALPANKHSGFVVLPSGMYQF